MPIYQILLLGAEGQCLEKKEIAFDSDDDAIDHTGWIDHPLEMEVWEGGRLVASFPRPDVSESGLSSGG